MTLGQDIDLRRSVYIAPYISVFASILGFERVAVNSGTQFLCSSLEVLLDLQPVHLIVQLIQMRALQAHFLQYRAGHGNAAVRRNLM